MSRNGDVCNDQAWFEGQLHVCGSHVHHYSLHVCSDCGGAWGKGNPTLTLFEYLDGRVALMTRDDVVEAAVPVLDNLTGQIDSSATATPYPVARRIADAIVDSAPGLYVHIRRRQEDDGEQPSET